MAAPKYAYTKKLVSMLACRKKIPKCRNDVKADKCKKTLTACRMSIFPQSFKMVLRSRGFLGKLNQLMLK